MKETGNRAKNETKSEQASYTHRLRMSARVENYKLKVYYTQFWITNKLNERGGEGFPNSASESCCRQKCCKAIDIVWSIQKYRVLNLRAICCLEQSK